MKQTQAFHSEVEAYYEATTRVTINNEVEKAFVEAGKRIAQQIVKQYNMTQLIKHEVEGIHDKIIITTVFEKKL